MQRFMLISIENWRGKDMAIGYNKVTLLGGLTREPELKYSNNGGQAYMRFSLACGRSVKNKTTGNYEEVADYVPCAVFGKTAEVIAKYCTKGSQLFIDGRINTSKYQGKDGRDVYDTHVLVSEIRFAGGKRKEEGQPIHKKTDIQRPEELEDFPLDFSDMPDADVPF